MKTRSFKELQKIKSFYDRYEYLRIKSIVGERTFGFDRQVNQILYSSKRWKRIRDQVIIRDDGCDLGCPGFEIQGRILIHHMNPITLEEVEDDDPAIYDLNFLICTSNNTHLAIHYGDRSLLPSIPIIRTPGDTTPWH